MVMIDYKGNSNDHGDAISHDSNNVMLPLGARGAGPLNFVLIGSSAILQTEFVPDRDE